MDRSELRGMAQQLITEAQHSEGGWGYQAGSALQLEPTLYAVAGGFPLPRDMVVNVQGGWGLLLLPAFLWPQAPELCTEALHWIQTHRSTPGADVMGFNATLLGWNWIDGTAAWVIPSCWAMLSLARAGQAPELRAEGQRLLLDRQCKDGGWNYGNPRMLDNELPAMPETTAWSMLALQAVGYQGPALQSANQALEKVLEMPGIPSLALAILARQRLGGEMAALGAALAGRIAAGGLRGRVDWAALSLLAWDAEEGRNVFG